jgi:two-component system, OmpR family, KDP operon response regulator KdpE
MRDSDHDLPATGRIGARFMSKPSILLVDDESALVAVLEPVLKAAGYDVASARTGAEALGIVETFAPSLILLDLGLPDLDGKEVIRLLRMRLDTPIIVISARHQEVEKVAALDDGADDYVDKPFEIGELMARIRVALRRGSTLASEAMVYASGFLLLDFKTRHVTLGGEVVRLSPKEYGLLEALARNAGQVVTHKRLLSVGWGSSATDTQYLRVYIGLLRQKIEQDASDPKILLTEPGVGYRLVAAG